eukprot:5579358-Prymnesium_polylepis.1
MRARIPASRLSSTALSLSFRLAVASETTKVPGDRGGGTDGGGEGGGGAGGGEGGGGDGGGEGGGGDGGGGDGGGDGGGGEGGGGRGGGDGGGSDGGEGGGGNGVAETCVQVIVGSSRSVIVLPVYTDSERVKLADPETASTTSSSVKRPYLRTVMLTTTCWLCFERDTSASVRVGKWARIPARRRSRNTTSVESVVTLSLPEALSVLSLRRPVTTRLKPTMAL